MCLFVVRPPATQAGEARPTRYTNDHTPSNIRSPHLLGVLSLPKPGRKRRKHISHRAVDLNSGIIREQDVREVELPDLVRETWPGILVFFIVLLYAFWPTLIWVEESWRKQPDYSHGYLVPFLAGLLCWYRQESFPGIRNSVSWAGLWLIGLAIVMRFVSRMIYADFFDAWAILPLIVGAIWFVWGAQVVRWFSPAAAFLFLMFPLPYQAEKILSYKLQGIATDLSTVFLRILGQPAVAEGHVIWVQDQRLLVEEACSGLRIFVGVAALAFFWAVLANRSWIDRLILMASVMPVAILVNTIRITAVGLLYQEFDDGSYHNTIHDWTGYLMIPLAFGILWLIKTYWEHLYRPVENLTAKDFVRSPA